MIGYLRSRSSESGAAVWEGRNLHCFIKGRQAKRTVRVPIHFTDVKAHVLAFDKLTMAEMHPKVVLFREPTSMNSPVLLGARKLDLDLGKYVTVHDPASEECVRTLYRLKSCGTSLWISSSEMFFPTQVRDPCPNCLSPLS